MADTRDQLRRLGALMKAFRSNDASSLEVCNAARDIDFDALAEACAWIPVAARLPDDELTVMIAMTEADEPVWLGYLEGGNWYSVDGVQQQVTHWRPIPEGPHG